MADDERKKGGLKARWQDRKAHRAERAAQKAERRARLVGARDSADGQARTNTGSRVR